MKEKNKVLWEENQDWIPITNGKADLKTQLC